MKARGALLIMLLMPLALLAEEQEYLTMQNVMVIGSAENVSDLPGSGYYIDRDDIRTYSYDDINHVLRKVPGVYLREEDGFGLFPNISLRGVDAGRTQKVTVMEDGILAAPAPYSAPSAYYSPTTGRMHAIEVLKGSSQIRYGPHTTGGAINYLSTPIPNEEKYYIKTLYGSFDEIRTHLNIGNTIETQSGRLGVLVELYYRENDGFKEIDLTPDFKDGDNTGFRKIDPMIKLSWEPNTLVYQRFEFKFGYSDLEANETYLGLTDEDFSLDPNRRYAASRFDNIQTEHYQTYLRHYIELNEDLSFTTTLYYNNFHRNWFKLRGDGEDLLDPAILSIWKGEAAGDLKYRNNNRDYFSGGIETVMNYAFKTGDLVHDVLFSVRYHQDEIRRFQTDEIFVQAADGSIVGRSVGTAGDGGNRLQESEALAFFVQDAIEFGSWTFTPGIRYEHIWQDFEDFAKGETGEGSIDTIAPGIGVLIDANEYWAFFGGLHRGISVPSPRAAIREDLDEETSLGIEVGSRFDNKKGFQAEAVFFYTDFNDLIVPDNIGSGGGGDTQNVGDIHTVGLELLLAYDPAASHEWNFNMPSFLSFTYTQAELDGDASTEDTESIFSFGVDGSNVPYIPEYQVTLGTGVEFDRWSIHVEMVIVDETFTSASNVETPVRPDGTPDAEFGKTDSYTIVNISGRYAITENISIVGTIHNLFDDEYIVSRHPIGPRPGKPFTALIGVEIAF